MFPTDVDFNTVTVSTNDDTADTDAVGTIGRSFTFDYESKRFIFTEGKVVETSKIDAIKQWIELYIRTEVNKYLVYTDSFGVDLKDLVSYRLPRSYQVAEIIRRINEGILTKCPDIVSVTNWSFDRGHFRFTVTTNTGEEVVISE